jgi:hypothetical protein
MGIIKMLSAPIRSLARFPLFQFAVVVLVIFALQAADEHSIFGQIFDGLDKLVDWTVNVFSAAFTVKSFTKSWLTFGFMIAYVYLACWLILFILRMAMRAMIDMVGRRNLFWLRGAIARERGIGAYRAWVPLERIRPAHISQREWEERYAWPPDDRPPYPPWGQRLLRSLAGYVVLCLIIAALLQAFTPLPALSWLGEIAGRAAGRH